MEKAERMAEVLLLSSGPKEVMCYAPIGWSDVAGLALDSLSVGGSSHRSGIQKQESGEGEGRRRTGKEWRKQGSGTAEVHGAGDGAGHSEPPGAVGLRRRWCLA